MTKQKVNPAPLEELAEVKDLLDALSYEAPDKVYIRLQAMDQAEAVAFVDGLKFVLKDS